MNTVLDKPIYAMSNERDRATAHTVGAARDGALENHLERLHATSFGWALACCRQDAEEAREVLQIAYLKTLEGRARFDGHSTLRTWFFGVVRNTAAQRRRRRLLRNLWPTRWRQLAPPSEPMPTPENLVRRAELEQELQIALRLLSRRQREVLHLVFYQEMTLEQAAEVLRLAVGTARTHYARGKARLRSLIEGTAAAETEKGERVCASTTITTER
jgi:RNA polymerase sigma factor (sigma-70 family)